MVGEIGLDESAKNPKTGLKYDYETQFEVFNAQFNLACELQRSVSIHAVQVSGKLYDFMSKIEKSPPTIMLHSFNGSSDMIKRLLKIKGIGHKIYFSLSLAVSLRSSRFQEIVLSIPDDRILIESDCHDIAKLDGCMEEILEKVANVKGWDLEMAVSILSRNTLNYFT